MQVIFAKTNWEDEPVLFKGRESVSTGFIGKDKEVIDLILDRISDELWDRLVAEVSFKYKEYYNLDMTLEKMLDLKCVMSPPFYAQTKKTEGKLFSAFIVLRPDCVTKPYSQREDMTWIFYVDPETRSIVGIEEASLALVH